MLELGDDQEFQAWAASEIDPVGTERRLQDSRWQFAIEGAGDGVWDWNVSDSRVFFSKQWKALGGELCGEWQCRRWKLRRRRHRFGIDGHSDAGNGRLRSHSFDPPSRARRWARARPDCGGHGAATSPNPPFIMHTLLASKEAREHAMQSGADDFLAKPSGPSLIRACVASADARRKNAASTFTRGKLCRARCISPLCRSAPGGRSPISFAARRFTQRAFPSPGGGPAVSERCE